MNFQNVLLDNWRKRYHLFSNPNPPRRRGSAIRTCSYMVCNFFFIMPCKVVDLKVEEKTLRTRLDEALQRARRAEGEKALAIQQMDALRSLSVHLYCTFFVH